MKHSLRYAFFALILLLSANALARTKLFVDGEHGNDGNNCLSPRTACKTIGHAISLASAEDAILVAPGLYKENLSITSSLQLIGSGADFTTIDGGQLDSVVSVRGSDTRAVLLGFTVRNGSATYNNWGCGGGIHNEGNLSVFETVVVRNAAGDQVDDGVGGGVCNVGTLKFSNGVVAENVTQTSYFASGGGIYNTGTATITDSTISANSSQSTNVSGAGVYNAGHLLIARSTISGNHIDGAYTAGGGLYNDESSTLILNDSTIYGNRSDGGEAGGIENLGSISIDNSSIVNNEAYAGDGGIDSASVGSLIIQNTIVANNEENCFGTLTSNGYNLSSDDTCNFNGPGDLNDTEPKLGPLRNNGGATQTMAELPGSPTIDAGNPQGCTNDQGHLLRTDQRGFPRPGLFKHKHRCDMGAYEKQTD